MQIGPAAITLAVLLVTSGSPHDRRIVDTADVGNPVSEASHGYVGHHAIVGIANGASFREARGWMRYALGIFDDTDVTLSCTFSNDTGELRGYDVIVEDSVIATRTLGAMSRTPAVVEFSVPFSLTKGKAHIAIVIRARGGPTPAVHRIRTIQDHNELLLSTTAQTTR